MLTHIHIKNFTLVAELNLDFHSGFNVLTGETGAGKSIWIDAVLYALGARIDGQVIREGEKRCDITLCFDISNNPPAQLWLQQHAMESADECIIRRSIYNNQQSRSSINGNPSPQALIRELAGLLIVIHSQHQHQHLLTTTEQRHRLDRFANNRLLLTQIEIIYQNYLKLHKKLGKLQQQTENRSSELALLQYQLDELRQLSLTENEWQMLTQEHQRLHQAKQLMQTLNQALAIAIENEQLNAVELVQQVIQQVSILCEKEPQLKSAYEMLQTAIIHLEEASDELQQFRNSLDLSPEHLAEVEKRLTHIHDLARKHHVNPEDLKAIEKSLAQKIDALTHLDNEIANLQQEKKHLLSQYQIIADQVSKNRKCAAEKLQKIISAQMQQLGMQNGQFIISLETHHTDIHPAGNENVQFQVITNPGQSPQTLTKIASGGELSRIGLALQVTTANQNDTQTLIFDEVDVGIGGKTAAIIGQLLQTLGNKIQLLCITHLPQVAAFANHHYQVQKFSQNQHTFTQIKKLTKQQRIDELARMLGGTKITQQTRAHAEELMNL